MASGGFFDGLPAKLSLEALVSAPKRPELLELSNELLQKYNRDFAPSSPDVRFSNRVYHAGMYALPFLTQAMDTRKLRALEIGCGNGPYSAILSHAFREYVGVELRAEAVQRATAFCKSFGASNATFVLDEAANMDRFLENQPEKFDVFILQAVVEHLVPEDRLAIISACWKHLKEGGYLFLGEAPNAIHGMDMHSSHLVYFQQMPLDMWKYFFEESDAVWWKNQIRFASQSTDRTRAYNAGIPVGFREIERGLGIPDIGMLRPHIVSDNYDVFLLNRYSYHRFDFLKLCEIRQMEQYLSPEFSRRTDVQYKNLPDFFSRYYLEALLRKTPMSETPSDWSVQSIDNAMPGTSDMVVEGRELSPGDAQIVELPPRLAADAGADIDVMLQVLEPVTGGVLVCTTQSGKVVFERNLWEAMRQVGKWRLRMVFQLPRLSASDFPLKISCQRKTLKLTYVFLRAVPAPAPSAGVA